MIIRYLTKSHFPGRHTVYKLQEVEAREGMLAELKQQETEQKNVYEVEHYAKPIKGNTEDHLNRLLEVGYRSVLVDVQDNQVTLLPGAVAGVRPL